jgi:drug/metabolite transporter (DMT)-like permease
MKFAWRCRWAMPQRAQAIEVGMVNYLWPSLTIVFAILFNGQKSTLWVIPGLAISLLGCAGY